jgi:CYTH domain-containing protein
MIEKERKFKLKYLPQGLTPMRIKQGYLMIKNKKNLRVRIINDEVAYFTFKISIDKSSKDEFEYQIPLSEAIEMYSKAEKRLEKTRYKTKFNGNNIDIDVYPDGLKVVEIEYEDNLKDGDIPDYCGEEITGISKYSNIKIAK